MRTYNGENKMENAEFKWNISDEMLITLALDIKYARSCALFCSRSVFLSVCINVTFKRILFHSISTEQ